MQTHPSAAPISTKACNFENGHRMTRYIPTIWGDYFLKYTSESMEMTVGEKEELQRQKDMVRKLLMQTPDDSLHKAQLIDAIQRLGVAYHFECEIEKSLQYMHQTYPEYNSRVNNLHDVALRFRLLRQQGYPVQSGDAFSKFMMEESYFKEELKNDIQGMLSLYEAAHFGQQGEEILEKALKFSSSHLHSWVQQMRNTSFYTQLVNEALKIPLQKSLTRAGARTFLSIYQKDDSHNELLLKFAKLDFNIVQKLHQKELCDITRWWKALDLVKELPHARDRIVECYFWILGVYFEPQYNTARKLLTKVISIASIIDDTFEYGTLDELHVFTDAIQRWDVKALEELPAYTKKSFKALLDLYVEIEDKTARLDIVQYAKEDMKKLVRAYFEERKWIYNKYIPTMEEYMKVALVSSAYMMLSTNSLLCMGDLVRKEDFDWISSEPPIVRASSLICRIMNDLVGDEFEEKPSSVHCYMNEEGTTEEEAFVVLRTHVMKAWKVINEECLEPRAVSMPILMRVVNLARVINLLYAEEDGYSNPTNTKELVQSVLVEPVSIC